MAVVVLWAVVLIPMWLRNHDERSETRSVDRFSTAMRTLSRRGSGSGSGELLVPGRARAAEVTGGRAPSAAARRARAAAEARMRRRRTVLTASTGFLAVVLVTAALGAAPLWLGAASLVGYAVFVRHLRVQARNAAAAERRRRRREQRPPVRNAPAEPVAPIWPVGASRADAVTEVIDRRTPVTAETEVVADATGWAPTPVVLPTYVTAPPATSVPRVIDLTHPGSWSAERMLEHANPAYSSVARDEIFDQYDETPAAPQQHASLADEHEVVAETVAGSTSQPFLEDDAVFDQDEDLPAFLQRRASGH